VVLLLCLCACAVACGAPNDPAPPDIAEPVPGETERRGYADAIDRVLERDRVIGAERNRAPEQAPLADAVRRYVAGIDAIDFGGCPPEFTEAFRRHRDAWEASIVFFERFDGLRGEMHDVFDEIRRGDDDVRAELHRIEDRIWQTWDEVEAAARDYRVAAPPD
jgi:hypothetical protein